MSTPHVLGQSLSHHLDAKIALDLASIAYDLESAPKPPAFPAGWSLAWKPDAAVHGIYAYVAKNADGSQYVVAIRGSLLQLDWAGFDNWIFVDLDVFKQDTWNYPAPSNGAKKFPKISRGSSNALGWFQSLKQGSTDILTYLQSLPASVSIGVTGHSLGGGLATTVAPWLKYQFEQAGTAVPSLPVYTFAAPAVGNEEYASFFDQEIPQSFRYYNELDVVPRFAVAFDVSTTGFLYSPKIEASDCELTLGGYSGNLGEVFGAIGAAIKTAELVEGFGWLSASSYTQTNSSRGSNALNQNHAFGPIDPTESACLQFIHQVAYQHSHVTYQKLLG